MRDDGLGPGSFAWSPWSRSALRRTLNWANCGSA